MKIAMVTEYLAPRGKYYIGGVDARTINIAKILSHDNEIHIITSFIEDSDRIEHLNDIEILRVGPRRGVVQKGDLLNRAKFNSEISNEILRLKPDIVDASGLVSYAGSYKGANRLGIPSVATVHDVWQGRWVNILGLVDGVIGNMLERHYLKYPFDSYISVSNFTRDQLVNSLGISKERISVIYNGVDLDFVDSIKDNEKYPTPTLISISRLVSYKRIDDLIRSVGLLVREFPDIKLKLVGNGPQEGYLRKLSRNLGIEDNVDFLTGLSNGEVIQLLKKSHVFIMPSEVEGFCMTIIEAMAANIPYVASNIAPISEVTNGGVGGILFTPRDHKGLAENISRLLNDKSSYRKLSNDGRKYVERYDWSNIGMEAEKFYQNILDGDAVLNDTKERRRKYPFWDSRFYQY
jgi:glycosyltransferase involved in cell wall biosynthesis